MAIPDYQSFMKPLLELASDRQEHSISEAYEPSELTEQLAGEVLSALHQASPSFFEQVVIELLVAMGYGGSRKVAARKVGRSGDAGIDGIIKHYNGIIKEDRLGLHGRCTRLRRAGSDIWRI